MNIGIIGCGLIGKKRAIELQDNNLIAVADTVKENALKFRSYNPALIIYEDWKSLLKNHDIDCVIIATPHNLLAEIAIEAINHDKHVLVEKPAGISVSELKKLHDKSLSTDKVVKIGFNHRFHPAFIKAKALFDDGELGELMFIRARYGHGGRIGYDKEWRANPSISGGGELIDQGVHLIDLSRWFLGEFNHIEGFAHTYYWDMPVDDNSFLMLRNEKNQCAWLHASCSEWKNTFSFEIYGKNGKIHIEGLGASYGTEKITFYKMLPEMGPPETTTWEFPMADRSWKREFDNFVDTINGKASLCGNVRDAYEAMKIVKQIYRENGYDHH